MKKIFKSLVATAVTSAMALSVAQAATYQVVDKGEVSSLKYTYAQKQNSLGESVLSGTKVYDFPVQFQYLDEDDFDNVIALAKDPRQGHLVVSELEDIEDEASLREGNPTANDLSWVIRYLQSTSSNLYQKVGDTVALVNQGAESQEFAVFDEAFDGTSDLTRSTIDYVNGITDNGWVYGNGSSPYLPLNFTQDDGGEVTFWLREFATRAFISPDFGQTIKPILPPETSYYGGESAILNIQDNYAVGYASTGTSQNLINLIEDESGGCLDPDILKDVPYEVCVQNFVSSSSLYDIRAYKWTLDDNANVVAEQSLGLLVTPHEDDERKFSSYAQAINSQGVTVGFSHGWVDEDETDPSENESRSSYAVVFKDGEVISLTEDHSKYFDSRAYDINNNGIAVGHVSSYISGDVRTKFYYIDTNVAASDMTMVLPDDYFNSSSSTARAINDNGLIVGEGEVETHSSSSTPRRRHAFLYDLHNDTFTNLNDLLECNSDYTIIEARDINDNNEIYATAVVKVPRRDSKGEILTDAEGNQLEEDVVRAVTLKPIDGEIEDCSKVENVIERKGASFGLGLLALLATFGFRRKL